MSSPNVRHRLQDAAQQHQFLNVLTRDEAAARFEAHLQLAPLGAETVPLSAARGRVLAEDVVSEVDVPAFDRSNVDGFALQARDTVGAMEESRRRVRLNPEVLSPGVRPQGEVAPGTATTIATGGMLPRGADCVVMVEHTELLDGGDLPVLELTRAAAPGQFVTFAGTDIARGETVLRSGTVLTSREIGVLAAIGRDRIPVCRRPRVGIISTGDEVVRPGMPLPAGCVYDSNAAILAAAVEELGGEPIVCGTIPDDEPALRQAVADALQYDVVILSGGTSKGAGDLSYRVVSGLGDPGIVAHGVALKPGKPICLAVTQGKPVVVLPGFPTSAIFTFHEFVAPVIRAYAGRPPPQRATVEARLPLRVNSERGRTEYLLVGLVRGAEGRSQESGVRSQGGTGVRSQESGATGPESVREALTPDSSFLTPPLVAYPLGKGSGSVTTFSHADGFITIDQHTEIVEAGSKVTVTLLDQGLAPADLVVIGSHCVGLDYVLGLLQREGFAVKSIYVGSTGGLAAAARGECDLAGIHLLDPQSGEYNRSFVGPGLELIPGYRRTQCIVFRRGDARFEGRSAEEAIEAALSDPTCTMVNRNAGSGTRILIDELLDSAAPGAGQSDRRGAGGPGSRPRGYGVQAKSHNAVAAAVVQARADWGLAIATVAHDYGLGAIPVRDEHYDFVTSRARRDRPAVMRFRELLEDGQVRAELGRRGFGVQGLSENGEGEAPAAPPSSC
jgi:putative molybdopterin biosynthesis protein